MGDENPIRTLRDYSKPSHEGFRNTIKLPHRWVINVYLLITPSVGRKLNALFHGLRSEDPNQHLKDFLKLVDLFDLDGANRERMRLHLFQFSLRDHAINWLERLPAGSITTWEDLTTRFLAQFFPPGRTKKLRNDILMFQQHHGESLSEAWTLVPMTLKIAWKIPNKPLLNTHPLVLTKRETSLPQTGMGIETQQLEEPEPTLKDEFQDLHLNLTVLEVLAHTPIYYAILDKYVESLELGKNGSAFVQGEVPTKMEDPGLFTIPCRLGDSKPFDTLADLGSCLNIIPLYLFKKLNIGPLEETDHIFGLADGTKAYPVGIMKDVEVHIGKLKLLIGFYVIDMKKDPETPFLVGRGFLATSDAVIDCRKAKIAVGEGITRESNKPRPRSDRVGARTPYYARKDFLDCHLPGEWEIARDVELNPFKDKLVFRRMVEFLGAIPINLKSNMWELEDLIKKPD
ncbi:MAK10-like protein [Tanacetum coccineum]